MSTGHWYHVFQITGEKSLKIIYKFVHLNSSHGQKNSFLMNSNKLGLVLQRQEKGCGNWGLEAEKPENGIHQILNFRMRSSKCTQRKQTTRLAFRHPESDHFVNQQQEPNGSVTSAWMEKKWYQTNLNCWQWRVKGKMWDLRRGKCLAFPLATSEWSKAPPRKVTGRP